MIQSERLQETYPELLLQIRRGPASFKRTFKRLVREKRKLLPFLKTIQEIDDQLEELNKIVDSNLKACAELVRTELRFPRYQFYSHCPVQFMLTKKWGSNTIKISGSRTGIGVQLKLGDKTSNRLFDSMIPPETILSFLTKRVV